jgi:HSP20 family molecular chaperone IbpA
VKNGSSQEVARSAKYRSEPRYGHFYRSIPLPDGVKSDQVRANKSVAH